MRKKVLWFLSFAILIPVALFSLRRTVVSQTTAQLDKCAEFAYSTEVDFVTKGPLPPDGNPIISDGDLLGPNHSVCMRNSDLLSKFDLQIDLGLDAVDVIDVANNLVAFSTELDDPEKRFTEGDLLTTWGAVIPNQALLIAFQVQGDRGLDAVHFVGKKDNLLAFHETIMNISRAEWLKDPGSLITELDRFQISLWFSIEGTEQSASVVSILDGDLLSADGVIVRSNADLLPVSVPAGVPNRGVDFGLDAFSAARSPDFSMAVFSTEILYRDEASFTDGDVLAAGDGIDTQDVDLYKPFEPLADFLGTDALYVSPTQPQPPEFKGFLPLIRKALQQLFR
jgi:hypothetical protein